VLSLDYLEDQGHYEDYDNLYAMYLLYNLGRYSIVLDGAARRLKVEARKEPDAYEVAKKKARESATKRSLRNNFTFSKKTVAGYGNPGEGLIV